MGQTEQLMITPLGEMADDVIYNLLLLKLADPSNSFLPFLYAHSLELSAKTACLKLEVDYPTVGHNLMNIYKCLSAKVPDLNKYIPTEQHLNDYKKVWVSAELILKKSIDILNPKERQPNLNELKQLELAYFIDNVMDLKYRINKKKAYVSVIQITYQGFNPYFMNLFISCRNIYKTPSSDKLFSDKFFKTFEKTNENIDFVNKFLNKNSSGDK